MNVEEAREICEQWLAHIERYRQRADEILRLGAMARAGQQDEARRRRQAIESSFAVYYGSRLEPAVRALLRAIPEREAV